MRCMVCGNENVNEMLVEFFWIHPEHGKVIDTTTLPKFLHYLRYPEDRRMKGEFQEGVISTINRVVCDAEAPWEGEEKPGIHAHYEPPDRELGRKPEIRPTRFGI